MVMAAPPRLGRVRKKPFPPGSDDAIQEASAGDGALTMPMRFGSEDIEER